MNFLPRGVVQLAIRIFFLLRGHAGKSTHVGKPQANRQNSTSSRTVDNTNRDLERAEAEARRSERLAALGHLSAGLAHEIRNPLGVIKGSAEMLHQKLEGSDPLASELAGYISSEVNRASALVSRFLDFARPLRTETRLVQVTALLDQAINFVDAQWQGPKISVKRQYGNDLPLLALDEKLSEQAFLNLVQNAYEAMDATGGSLTVQVSTARSNGCNGVEIRLLDTGPGVSAEMRRRDLQSFS